jgi:uncharacterized iron-regulated protein
VQVVWDETMADTAAKWLAASGGGEIVILAGNGHCHDSAIVARMKRRGIAETVSLRTIIDEGEGEVADALARPMNDFLIVLEPKSGQHRNTGLTGIEAAALPYHVLDRTGHEVDPAAFWGKLAAARAVCVGEEHPNPHHHWVQLEVVRQLSGKWSHFALGMEMFQRPFQGVLDDFAAKKIDDEALRSRTGWEDRWGYDYAFYGPTITAAVGAHASLVALNAARELTKKIAHHGLQALSPDERAQVPELDLKDAKHRAWFDTTMEEMGGSEAHGKKSPNSKR